MRPSGISRTFTDEDQQRFARASGDGNPMHVDARAARRTQAGAPVVHGMHALLWALDELVARGELSGSIRGLDADFRKFLFVGEPIELRGRSGGDSAVRAELAAGDLTLAVFTFALEPPGEAPAPFYEPEIVLPRYPRAPSAEEIARCAGAVAPEPEHLASAMFPHASRALGAARIEGIARLSAIVGMVCPGLHSIFNRLSLGCDGPMDEAVSFRCERFDARFGRAHIAFSGAGVRGRITAFVRESPVEPPSIGDLRALVAPGEFAGARALIVGGSRGLGAIVARAIVAGSGSVAVTYVNGEEEAAALVAEIGDGTSATLRYDAREPSAAQLEALPWLPNEVYYFATPKIFVQKSRPYVHELFEAFARIYVEGLESLCSALVARGAARLTIFYPSSVALDDCPKELVEYAMAKGAGEFLCAQLERFNPGLRVVMRRLPRMRTDQTATVLPVAAADAVAAMLEIVRAMKAAESTNRERPA